MISKHQAFQKVGQAQCHQLAHPVVPKAIKNIRPWARMPCAIAEDLPVAAPAPEAPQPQGDDKDLLYLMRSGTKLTAAAQLLWSQIVKPGDTVVDATCGNGYDTLALAKLVGPKGAVYGFDIQESAVASTRQRLAEELSEQNSPTIKISQLCHSQMQQVTGSCVASCIVFNLGYFPGGDKKLVTEVSSTLAAVEAALEVVRPGGLISMLLYHGHPGGAEEAAAVRQLASELSPSYWVCTELQLLNRPSAPYVLNIWRRDDDGMPHSKFQRPPRFQKQSPEK